MNAAILLIACGGGLAVASQGDALTGNQTWTLVGILGLVSVAAIKGAHWICNRFVAQLDKQHEKLTCAIEKNSDAVVGNTNEIVKLVGELRTQSQQHSQFQTRLEQDRAHALVHLDDKIDAVPKKVAEELHLRKLA